MRTDRIVAGSFAAALVLAAVIGSSGEAFATGHYGLTVTTPVGKGPAGVAISLTTFKEFVANWGPAGHTVSVLDQTHNLIDTIAVGAMPGAIAIDHANDRVYVVNEGDNSVSIIDGASDAVLKTVSVGDNPDGIAINDATGQKYIANRNDGTLTVLDSADSVAATVTVGSQPTGVAVYEATGDVFVSDSADNAVSEVDTALGVTTFAVGRAPANVQVNQSNGTIYVANFDDDTVSVVPQGSLAAMSTVNVGHEPESLAIDPGNGDVYVTNLAFGASPAVVTIIDASNVVAATVVTGDNEPWGVAFDEHQGAAVVTNFGDNTLSVIQHFADPVITSGMPPAGTSGRPYSFTVTATGAPAPTFSITAGSLLAGLSLDPSTGVISGNPRATGISTFTVTVSNGSGSDATATLSISVAPGLRPHFAVTP